MRFDNRGDVLAHLQQTGKGEVESLPYKVEDFGDEIILSIPDKRSTYMYQMGKSTEFNYQAIQKAVHESAYWVMYISRNDGKTWKKMG